MSSLEKFISLNLELILLNPFGENQLRPCSSRKSIPFFSSSYPIGTACYLKPGRKPLVFLKNTMKILLGFRNFFDISSILTLIFARKLSFQSVLQDSLKFNTPDQKVNFFTIPDQGFCQIFSKIVFFKCCDFLINHSNMLYLFFPFWL